MSEIPYSEPQTNFKFSSTKEQEKAFKKHIKLLFLEQRNLIKFNL